MRVREASIDSSLVQSIPFALKKKPESLGVNDVEGEHKENTENNDRRSGETICGQSLSVCWCICMYLSICYLWLCVLRRRPACSKLAQATVGTDPSTFSRC